MKLLNKLGLITLFSLGFSVQSNAVDNPKYSPNAGNTQKGILHMEDLYIGGIKSHKDVKIEFDFSNSTFVILGATPTDNSIPPEAIETLDAGGLSVGLRGCISKNRSVTCHLSLTSTEFDRTIKFCGKNVFCIYNKETKLYDGSTVFDNLNNQYYPSKITIANFEDTPALTQKLVANVPTEATIIFDNLSTSAINFTLLDLGFEVNKETHRVTFRNVDIK